MHRRAFLSLSTLPSIAPWLTLIGQEAKRTEKTRELSADVLICGGGVGGIAAALAAARAGLNVIVTEQNDWIGGQLTSQAVPPDEYPEIETVPCTKLYAEFRTRIRDYYRRNYPLTEAAKKSGTLNPGNGSVSRLCHEPRVAVAVLLELLAPHLSSGRVRLLQPYVAIDCALERDRIRAVGIQHTGTGTKITVTAKYFVDATELGDLLPITRTEFVTGAESQKETGEPHAPAAANAANHQAFTCCFAMDFLKDEDHTIAKPQEYEFWKNYVPRMTPAWTGALLSWKMTHPITLLPRDMGFDPTGPTPKGIPNLWTYRRIADRNNFHPGTYPGDVCLVNWPQNDYWLGNLIGPKPEEVARHIARAKQLSLSLLYWMQTEAPRPDGKTGWKGLRLRPDLVGTEDGLAQYPYVRESRRIRAEFTVTENHVGADARAKATKNKPGEFTAVRFRDSVGIGSYRIDLHPSSAGDNYIDVSSLPFQIPLGALIPQRVENLLAACKNIGTTHITNGCYRLHPVEWNIGEAAGNLVAFCLSRKVPPRKVRNDEELLKSFQSDLRTTGVQIEWPADIASKIR